MLIQPLNKTVLLRDRKRRTDRGETFLLEPKSGCRMRSVKEIASDRTFRLQILIGSLCEPSPTALNKYP